MRIRADLRDFVKGQFFALFVVLKQAAKINSPECYYYENEWILHITCDKSDLRIVDLDRNLKLKVLLSLYVL